MSTFTDEFVIIPSPAAKGKRKYDEFLDSSGSSKTFSVNGVSYCLYYSFGRQDLQPLRDVMRSRDNCNACTSRASSLAGYSGPNGPLFLDNVTSEEDGCPVGTFYRVRDKLLALNKENAPVTAVIVREGMFPKINEGFSEVGSCRVPFRHPTIVPDSYTSPAMAAKYGPIFARYLGIISHRLEKLCLPEAIASVKIMADNVQSLSRPGHWKSVLKWVADVQKHFTAHYSMLSPECRVHLAVYALTTGRTDGNIHLDYQQSSNIVDFLTYSSVDALLLEMDRRSDPDNYMVSQLARAMAKHQVSSKHTISLVWEGKYTDDLDIHIRFGGTEVYYGNKTAQCGSHQVKLDFDANVSKGEKEPAENVSCCPGTFQVFVNNYTKRTRGDVPFTIIIHQEGLPDKVIERVWPMDRRSGDKLFVCDHTFTAVATVPLAMSEKDAARAKALNAKWVERFGTPVSSVPRLSELSQESYVTLASPVAPTAGDVNQNFMAMVASTSDRPRKRYLSEHVAQQLPHTLAQLVDYCRNGCHSVRIDPRNFAPGYITKIATMTDVTKEPYSLNHYEQKYKVPTGGPILRMGNARFSESWFISGTLNRSVPVSAFVKFGSYYFIVIDGTCLPMNDSDYPLGGGFYPTNLRSDVHDLRDRWAFCNTEVMPAVTAEDAAPLIGSFVVSDSVAVVLDGKPINLQTSC